MEDLAELRTICQTTAKKDRSNVYMRRVSRFFSIFITRVLIPTAVTPDQVSFIMILTGVMAGFVFSFPSPTAFLFGALILQLWYILDCVDGELARYRDYILRKIVTVNKEDLPITGAYWDYLNHYIVHGVVPFSISIGLYHSKANLFYVILGFGASFFQLLLLAIHDTRARAYVAKIRKYSSAGYTVSCRDEINSIDSKTNSQNWSPLKWGFVILHYGTTYPTVMNVITVTPVLMLVFHIELRGFLLSFYAIASAIVFLGLAAKSLINLGLDKDFDSAFHVQKRADLDSFP